MKHLWRNRREGRQLRAEGKQKALVMGPETPPKFSWACLSPGRYRGDIKRMISRASRFMQRKMDRSEIVDVLSGGVQAIMMPLFDDATSIRHKKRVARSSITSTGQYDGIVFGPNGCNVSL